MSYSVQDLYEYESVKNDINVNLFQWKLISKKVKTKKIEYNHSVKPVRKVIEIKFLMNIAID